MPKKAWIAKGIETLDSLRLFSNSRASTHFMKQRFAFSAYVLLMNIAGGSSKDSVKFKVEGMGTMAIKTSMNGVESVVKPQRALYCPDISANLISVSCLDKDGGKSSMEGEKSSSLILEAFSNLMVHLLGIYTS